MVLIDTSVNVTLSGPDNDRPSESAAMWKLAPPAGFVLTSSTSNEPLEPGAAITSGASMTSPSARQGRAGPRHAASTSTAAARASRQPGGIPWAGPDDAGRPRGAG